MTMSSVWTAPWRRWMAGAAAVAAIAGACAWNDPPSDEPTPGGGLPLGVTAGPANTQVGPITSPTPTTEPTPTPMPTREPLGNFIGERTGRVPLDDSTRLMSARLDSVLAGTRSGLTSMPIPVARGLVRSIAKTLHVSRVTRVHNVAVELDTLDMLLAQSPIDGRAVGRQLQRLSARAAAATPEAGVLASRVARLADVLNEDGARLARGQ